MYPFQQVFSADFYNTLHTAAFSYILKLMLKISLQVHKSLKELFVAEFISKAAMTFVVSVTGRCCVSEA
jgi:hypothetical protein